MACTQETMQKSVYVCVCVSLASDSSKTIEVIIKLGTATGSDMGLHHVLIILTVTFIQGHTDFNLENKKCLIISETVSNPHQICSKHSQTKGLHNLFLVR